MLHHEAPTWIDPQGRRLDYLRLSITDRCNLRCRYCMPEEGVLLVDREELLTFEELSRICRLFVRGGVRKIRITGGEPLVRPGLLPWLSGISFPHRGPEILLTTNGTLLHRYLGDLRALGLRRINLSLDTLNPATWRRITRRGGFTEAQSAVDAVLAAGFTLKINTVVQPGFNDVEIPDLVDLARDRPVTVRFIEPMPFFGPGKTPSRPPMTGGEILRVISRRWTLDPEAGRYDGVALTFRPPGFVGEVGIIEGHSRRFCSTCTRLRIDPKGGLRTCLYGRPVLDLKAMLRSGSEDAEIEKAVKNAILRKPKDGKAAERQYRSPENMVTIGG